MGCFKYSEIRFVFQVFPHGSDGSFTGVSLSALTALGMLGWEGEGGGWHLHQFFSSLQFCRGFLVSSFGWLVCVHINLYSGESEGRRGGGGGRGVCVVVS